MGLQQLASAGLIRDAGAADIGALPNACPLAVIIVNWNAGALLQRCLRSVASQTLVPHRVMVFDNASTDDSARAAAAEFPGVEFIHHNANTGFAWANNYCVARCTGCDWVLLINPDAFPGRTCLEQLLLAAERNRDFDVFAPLILQAEDPGIIDSAGDRYLASGIGLHRLHGQAQVAAGPPCEVFSATAAAALYRRQVFVDAGGFDASLFTWYEDVDLGFRLRLAGYRTLFVPDAVVHHVGGGVTGGADNDSSAYYCQRNFIHVFMKNMPGSLLWRNLPAHLWAISKGLVNGVRQGRGRLLARATWDACVKLPETLRARHQAGRMSKLSLAAVRESLAL